MHLVGFIIRTLSYTTPKLENMVTKRNDDKKIKNSMRKKVKKGKKLGERKKREDE